MKNTIIGIALALALVMGVVAFAETAEPATDPVPAMTEEASAEETAPSASEQPLASGDVEPRFVDAERLHHIGVIKKDSVYLLVIFSVFIMV